MPVGADREVACVCTRCPGMWLSRLPPPPGPEEGPEAPGGSQEGGSQEGGSLEGGHCLLGQVTLPWGAAERGGTYVGISFKSAPINELGSSSN